MITRAAMHARRWPDLPPDLVCEVSSRLHDVADFVHFHAVCKPWRASWSGRMTAATQFLPWLIAAEKEDSIHLGLRCLSSKSNYRAQSPLSVPQRNWVTSSGGTAVRCLTIEGQRPVLYDPFTGAATHLPLLPLDVRQWEKKIKPHGVVYGDGTALLYGISYDTYDNDTVEFRAALLCPGDVAWTVVRRTIERPGSPRQLRGFCVAYHDGKILVNVEAGVWHAVVPDGNAAHDSLVPRHGTLALLLRYREYTYVLESHVHALEEQLVSTSPAQKKMRWVRKDGLSLADRVLFLGSPNSFAMDAARLGKHYHGGYAYFINHTYDYELYGMFRCNLVGGEGELIERLPPHWDDNFCTWFNPQSVVIAPVQVTTEISERSAKDTKLKEQQPEEAVPIHTIHIERQRLPSLRLLVRNLPLNVKSEQLRLVFSEHGKVSDAKVIRYKKTGASQGIGHVTIEMAHAHQDCALMALNELVLDGCSLEVSLIKEGQPRRRRRQRRYI
ncbi:hypothetical protein VPH35_054074 [Triticum aestivum]|nr:uncharacterized protein LOC123065975 isoform X2 [Triticum aestivum]